MTLLVILGGVLVAGTVAASAWLIRAARRREAVRAASEAELRDVVDHAVDAIEVTTADGRLLYVNSAWLQMFGYPAGEHPTTGSESMVVAAHAEAYRSMRERLLSSPATTGGAADAAQTFEGVFVTRAAQRIVVAIRANTRRENGAAVAVRSFLRDVTALRRVQEAQTRLVATFEATTDFVCLTDRGGRPEYMNRAGRRMIGIGDGEDLAAIELSEVFAPEARRQFIELAVPAATRDGAWEGEAVVQSRDGRSIPVSVVVVAHASARGGVWFLSTIMRDITAQKRRERELVVLNTTAKAMAEAADNADTYHIALEHLCGATGWPYGEAWVLARGELIMDRAAVWHRPDAGLAACAAAMGQLRFALGQGLPGRVWESRRPYWHRDLGERGEDNDQDVPRAPITAAVGLQSAVGVPVMAGEEIVAALTFHMPRLGNDDTYLVRLVAAVAAQLGMTIVRKRVEEALRDTEQRFRRLSDASTDGIVVSRDGVPLDVNRAFCRMFGYSEEEARCLAAGALFIPRDRAIVARAVAEGWEHTYEATALRRDGSSFDAQLTGSGINYKGSVARITVVRDISDWKRLDQMKSEFVSTVSHELRTPLTSVRGALGLLAGGAAGALTGQASSLARIATENTDRLIRLINDMLDLDKMAAGKLDLRLTLLDAADVVRAAVDGIRTMAEQYHIQLADHVAAELPFRADHDRVLQVLTNLLANAIKFSPPGSTVQLTVTARETAGPPGPMFAGSAGPEGSEGIVRFAVENAGPGIAASDIDRLFRRFQQLDGSDNRKRGGTGLGLAISKAIVEQHGGTIGVESEPGVRTVFWFELPVLPFAACSELPS